ncbi:TPA: hemerythrin domain-containing protein [Candidatus Bathyarchaeota archaeon]|nr:hemerythrin domain-containing protein [Candidatus Bathyarchaeota archaeon]
MSRPIDTIRCFHTAFRRDIFQIDEIVYRTAREGGDFSSVLARLHTLNELLDYHARGEEAAVFPAMEKLAPRLSMPYLLDHRELDNMVNGLEKMRQNPDPLTTARATAVLDSFLRIHLNKEDAHLYPILRERTTDDEQVAIGALLAKSVPPGKFPTLIQWLFPLLDLEDQVFVAKGWVKVMPPQALAGISPLIQKAVEGNWVKLAERVPELQR